ncbi:uncharacterized protein [Diadema setosum]|uniref:uncharacterized protein n=1 Tax=Diadema setosum TaxID=31175 RepID=UPI003B3A4B2D
MVCGTNSITFWSACHLRRYACNEGVNVRVAYRGPCRLQPRPRTTKRPVTRRPPPTTTRRTTQAPPTTRPRRVTTTQPPLTNRPTTVRPVSTNPPATEPATSGPESTTPLPCPTTCELILDPVCTTVGTYQSECAFNLVRCRNIISQEEMILYRGYCMDSTTTGP